MGSRRSRSVREPERERACSTGVRRGGNEAKGVARGSSSGSDAAAIASHPGGSPVSSGVPTPIVVGSHEPYFSDDRVHRRGPLAFILQGHVDVVPTGPSRALKFHHSNPTSTATGFTGRGAGDVKAGHVAMFAAMDALARIGMQPAARVHVQSVVEESRPATVPL